MPLADLKNKKVLILGAGKTGLSSAKFLLGKAKEVFISESGPPKKDNEEKINSLIKEGAKVEFEKNSDEFLKTSDLIIISPGISPFSDIVKKINILNIPVISDIELASYFTNKPIIAVTGTNGKTTTTSLITHLINSSGKKAIACGNIGTPLIDLVNDDSYDFFVLELSSYQIFYSKNLHTKIAICMNITPDHLDWHRDINHYIASKKKLFLMQKENSWAVLNFLDDTVRKFPFRDKVFYFSSTNKNIEDIENIAYFENDILKIKTNDQTYEIIHKNKLKIIGLHNIENALAGIATGIILNIDKNTIQKSLENFEGVEHRLEYVTVKNGKEFYNDSKATNPEATIKAIEAIYSEKKGKNITLIAGGRDKNTSLDEMVEKIKNHVSNIILFGEAKERFYNELSKKNCSTKTKLVNDLNEAITSSLDLNDDVVLFSPACASFDMFKNYEERGKAFKQIIRNHK